MTEAIVVMLNNYFHDLAVAFLVASSLMAQVEHVNRWESLVNQYPTHNHDP